MIVIFVVIFILTLACLPYCALPLAHREVRVRVGPTGILLGRRQADEVGSKQITLSSSLYSSRQQSAVRTNYLWYIHRAQFRVSTPARSYSAQQVVAWNRLHNPTLSRAAGHRASGPWSRVGSTPSFPRALLVTAFCQSALLVTRTFLPREILVRGL